jgi:hypothetical protein
VSGEEFLTMGAFVRWAERLKVTIERAFVADVVSPFFIWTVLRVESIVGVVDFSSFFDDIPIFDIEKSFWAVLEVLGSCKPLESAGGVPYS